MPALPFPLSPIAGETLTSFLGRLSAVNHLKTGTLLEVLPAWFRVKIRWHDDRWQPEQLAPWTPDALTHLATVSGATTQALVSALPAFGAAADRPYRATDACRRCTAARRTPGPIPVHLPAHRRICLRHGIWLPAAGLPQLDISRCPDILEAEKRARYAVRQHSPEQMILAQTKAEQAIAGRIAGPHVILGQALARNPGGLPEAIDEFRAAERLKPDLAAAHYNLGIALAASPDGKGEAVTEFETATLLDPDNFQAHYNLAFLLSGIPGRQTEAIPEYEAAIRLKPDLFQARFNLGLILAGIPGRTQDAIAQFHAVLAAKPGLEQARRMIERLQAQAQ